MAGKLGILAGSGELPLHVIEACRAINRPVFVLGFEGSCTPATLAGVPHAWIRLGAAATGLQRLRENAVDELVMAGGVHRPSLWALRPDWRTLKFIAEIGFSALGHWGDDALLRAIIAALEHEGFRVLGVDSVLADLLAPLGALGIQVPDHAAETDIKVGLAAARDKVTRVQHLGALSMKGDRKSVV
jgi:UDP-2,3-diacylglucosamine hydrolase